MSYSQLTNSIIFQRGRFNHQPVIESSIGFSGWLVNLSSTLGIYFVTFTPNRPNRCIMGWTIPHPCMNHDPTVGRNVSPRFFWPAGRRKGRHSWFITPSNDSYRHKPRSSCNPYLTMGHHRCVCGFVDVNTGRQRFGIFDDSAGFFATIGRS